MEENNIIPDGWISEDYGDLIIEKRKSTLKVSDATNFGVYPFFTSGESILLHNEKQIEGENIFLATGGVANVKFHNGEVAYSTDTYAITAKEIINTKFLFYYSQNIINYINLNYFQGSGLKHLQKKDFKKHKVDFPKTVKEQSKIAEILSKVDKAISETEVIIAKYNRIKTGLMQDLLTKGIDEKGNIRSEETHDFKDSPFGRIPKEWDFLQIANVYDLKSGITPLRSNKKYFSNDGHNWVKTLDLNEDYLFETEERVSDYALSNTSLKLMPVNSILIAMYGGWEQIGRTAILKKEAGTNQALTCLSNPKFEMNSDFVQLLLQYYRFKWKQFAVSTRKDPNITKTDIENFILTFPKDITEQNKIADKINSIKENISLNEVELNKLKSIKTGLMQDLLSGKKRVTHLIN